MLEGGGSQKIKIPLNDSSWIHRLVGFARRLKDLHHLYTQMAIVRFYGDKIVIEMTPENIKKFNDLMCIDVDGVEFRETDRDEELAIFKKGAK